MPVDCGNAVGVRCSELCVKIDLPACVQAVLLRADRLSILNSHRLPSLLKCVISWLLFHGHCIDGFHKAKPGGWEASFSFLEYYVVGCSVVVRGGDSTWHLIHATHESLRIRPCQDGDSGCGEVNLSSEILCQLVAQGLLLCPHAHTYSQKLIEDTLCTAGSYA